MQEDLRYRLIVTKIGKVDCKKVDEKRLSKGYNFDPIESSEVIGHLTISSAYPDCPSVESNRKLIRCSVAETFI